MKILDKKLKKFINLPFEEFDINNTEKYVTIKFSEPLLGFKDSDFQRVLEKENINEWIKTNNIVGVLSDKSRIINTTKATDILYADEDDDITFLEDIMLIDTNTGQPYYKKGYSIPKKLLIIRFIKE